VVASILGYILRDHILNILLLPLNQPLYFSSPAGGFSFIFSISLFFGFLVSLPVLVFEILGFIEPVMPSKIKYSALIILISSCILLLLGIVFAYFAALPGALHFLATFGGDEVRSLISTNEYFTFVTRYMIGFGMLFQLPLVLIFINKIHKLEVRSLMDFERWVILISFILAAILTPTPDVVNQLVMAVPIILLYQISVLVIWFINRRNAVDPTKVIPT
jgi:sec-independent protein translocase protein TatC